MRSLNGFSGNKGVISNHPQPLRWRWRVDTPSTTAGDGSAGSEIQKCRLRRKVKKGGIGAYQCEAGGGRLAEGKVYRWGPEALGGLSAVPHFPGSSNKAGEVARPSWSGWELPGPRPADKLRTRHFWREGAVGGVTYSSARTTRSGAGAAQRADK